MKKLLTFILLLTALVGYSQIVRDGSARYIVVNGEIMALVEKDVIEQLPAVYTLAAYNALTQVQKDTLNAVIVSDTAPGLSGTEITDGDYGDISIASGVWTLDTGVVDSAAVANGSIYEDDLAITNSPTDGYVMTYDSASEGFTWEAISGSEVGAGYNFNDISTDNYYFTKNQATNGGTATGKKIWNRITATADSLWLAKDSVDLVGSPFIVQNWNADSTVIRKGTNVNLYVPDSSAALTSDGIIIKNRHPITVIQTANSTTDDFLLVGDFTTFVAAAAPTFFTNNAATPTPNEANVTTDWAIRSSSGEASKGTLSSSTTAVANGTHAIEVAITSDIVTNLELTLEFSGLDTSKSYTITGEIRNGAGDSVNVFGECEAVDGWDSDVAVSPSVINSTTYTSFTVTAGANATTAKIRFAVNSVADAGDEFYVDNVTITEL